MDTTLTQVPAPTPAWRAVLRPLISSGGYRALTHNPALEGCRSIARVRPLARALSPV